MASELSREELVDCELKLRSIVKRDGGYRKGVTAYDNKTARAMREKLGRKSLKWDTELVEVASQKRKLIKTRKV